MELFSIIHKLKEPLKAIQRNSMLQILVYIGLALIMFGAMISNVTSEKIEARVYSLAEKDIYSPITIDYTKKTEELRKEAANAVPLQYTDLPEKRQEQIALIKKLFKTIKGLNSQAETKEAPKLTIKDKIEQFNKSITDTPAQKLTDEEISILLNATPNQLELAEEIATNAVNKVMEERVSGDNLSEMRTKAEDMIKESSISDELTPVLVKVAKNGITPNYIYDAEATKNARDKAISAVEKVQILENSVIVNKGQIITPDIMEKLQLVGLLDTNFNPYPYIGLGILVFILTVTLVYFLRDIEVKGRHFNSDLLMYLLIFFLTLSLMKVSSLLTGSVIGIGYMLPVAVGAMMLKLLINEQTALVSSMIFAVCGSIIFNETTTSPFQFTFGIYILFSCLAGVIFLGKKSSKSNILRTGLLVCLTNVLVVGLTLALNNGHYTWVQIGSYIGFAVLSGFLASVLTIGLIPFFEEGFGILSSLKLIELSNPNHPLLRKLLMEAPGTYHHSIVVANLSEAACESVGANGLLARVGAYYHDVGKTKRPHFFIENQMNIENPHDKIAPQLSKTIIIAHPYDGSEMLRKHHLPKEIIDIAEQHHGTTLLKYFYHKASQNSDKEVSEADFRYPGPKAQSKESAIVGIADAVEAAVRSLSKPTPVKIETLVNKIIADRVEDGQLNECDLTFKELDKISKTICETLQGMFHSRIEYPEEIKKKVSHG